MTILVKDIMSKPVFTIEWNKTVKDAARYLKRVRRGFLVVTRRRKPVGVISDKDLIYKVLAKDLSASKVKVKDIMTPHFVSVSPNEDITSAVRKMKRNNIHRLPVVDEGKLVGVVSLSDIARTAPGMVDLLEYRLKMKEMPIEIKEAHTSGICDRCGNYSERLENVGGEWLCESCKDELEYE